MIALIKNWPKQSELCTDCGKGFDGKHVVYYKGRRICTKCHDAAYEMDEWEREWREGERIPAAVAAVLVAVGALIVAFVVRVCG